MGREHDDSNNNNNNNNNNKIQLPLGARRLRSVAAGAGSRASGGVGGGVGGGLGGGGILCQLLAGPSTEVSLLLDFM